MTTLSELDLAGIRRTFHAHPESGWTEFRTTALLIEEIERLGFEVTVGGDALALDDRLGVPDDDSLTASRERAVEEGAPRSVLDRLGYVTGLVAERTFGDGSGPTVGVRVDIDALEVTEASDDDHRPAEEGFASRHPGLMHACGHDGHAAIGVGIARELDANDGFDGTLRVFFQPAEEGGRGGKPMSGTAFVEDVDWLFGVHLGLGHETGTVIAAYDRPKATVKFDVGFRGAASHAGRAPQAGRNALQAAATAIQNLYAIPRHADGMTRVNVGQVRTANAQNVIADAVDMRLEVRGESDALNEYMRTWAERVCGAAATMHDVDSEVTVFGEMPTFEADSAAVDAVVRAAEGVPDATSVVERGQIGGSEDFAHLAQAVQAHGGDVTFVGVGASNPDGHHTPRFDVDEAALDIGVDVLVTTIRSL